MSAIPLSSSIFVADTSWWVLPVEKIPLSWEISHSHPKNSKGGGLWDLNPLAQPYWTRGALVIQAGPIIVSFHEIYPKRLCPLSRRYIEIQEMRHTHNYNDSFCMHAAGLRITLNIRQKYSWEVEGSQSWVDFHFPAPSCGPTTFLPLNPIRLRSLTRNTFLFWFFPNLGKICCDGYEGCHLLICLGPQMV